MESPITQVSASIIIPTKNGGAIFKKVLNEVLNQKYNKKFEVIIVDSGSFDGTVDFIMDMQKNNSNTAKLEMSEQA
jgi:rhamnosyltransferase